MSKVSSNSLASITQLEDPLQLTVCDKQRLEFIGSIQNTGSVVVLRKTTMEVIAYSSNLPDECWVTRPPQIGEDFRNILEASLAYFVDDVSELIDQMIRNNMQRTFTTFAADEHEFTVSISSAGGDLFLLEFEDDTGTS